MLKPDTLARVVAGPHKDKNVRVVGHHPDTGLYSARVPKFVGDGPPTFYDSRFVPTLFQPSYLQAI